MINWLNLLTGLLLGFFLKLITDWSRRIKIKFRGFNKTIVNFGELYKLRFILYGYSNPGSCSCEIITSKGKTFAKWDESPNPLENDDLDKFVPEKVPSTFFQTLYTKKEYSIPIIIKVNSTYYIFDGWWFGKNKGYYQLPPLSSDEKITIIIRGNNFSNKKETTLNGIISFNFEC